MDEGSRNVLRRLREIRKRYDVGSEDLENTLLLGPGWIDRIESGDVIPRIDIVLAILDSIGSSLGELAALVPHIDEQYGVARSISAEEDDDELVIRFEYAKFDATFRLEGADLDQYRTVVRTLRDGLKKLVETPKGDDSEAIKATAVADTFLTAVSIWPKANPSDIWWFLVSRLYLDPFNHPAEFARLDLGQSWKRTAGWALEQVIVRHYEEHLRKQGIQLLIAGTEEKEQLISQLKVDDRIESDKVDILLVGDSEGTRTCYGALHVKASFAERRTDDVPLSRALIRGGYCSPLWTLDCKSAPAEEPVNRGELGAALGKGEDKRSAKRKDIEDDGFFTACFSYNGRTAPTPEWQEARARVVVCDFRDPEDAFSEFLVNEWRRFNLSQGEAS